MCVYVFPIAIWFIPSGFYLKWILISRVYAKLRNPSVPFFAMDVVLTVNAMYLMTLWESGVLYFIVKVLVCWCNNNGLFKSPKLISYQFYMHENDCVCISSKNLKETYFVRLNAASSNTAKKHRFNNSLIMLHWFNNRVGIILKQTTLIIDIYRT